MIVLASLTILLPFLAAIFGMLLGRRVSPELTACVPTGVATVLSAVVAFWQWLDPAAAEGTLTLIQAGTVRIGVTLSVDGTAAVVALMVCCVALAVQIYSVAYMRTDLRYRSYAAFVSLFTAAMLLVVYAGDLLVLYVGWEVMGVCSYFLIGHHWEERANSRAAVKAFLVTRVGDVGFLFGIFVLGLGSGTFSVRGVLHHVPSLPHTTLLAGTLLLLAGVAGKSAQFPLHTWLPDAMAGPTPISALIHAATMVAAGIYVVIRLYPAFLAVPASRTVLAVMAVVSMLGAALAAVAQEDLKRVLAYSTISQLGYMAAGLAAGSRSGALFHLLTHGAFKALLFLGAGCVITAVGSTMLRDMGGLRHPMPVTFWSMTIGFAALAGIPPASGFFSKDTILEAASQATSGLPAFAGWLLYLTMLATIAVTAAYATRAWLMTFFDRPRTAVDAKEAQPLMRWPVAVLAGPALLLGLLGLPASDLRPQAGTALLSLLLAAAGAGAAYRVWSLAPALDPVRVLGPARSVFAAAFHLDRVYDVLIVAPVRALAGAVLTFDDRAVDAAVEGTGPAARRLGGVLRRVQNGNPQAYLTGVLAGTVLIAAFVAVLR